MIRGLISAYCILRKGRQASASSGSGFLFPGGRHFTTFAIYTSDLFSPIASSIRSRSCPARPTNGLPCRSSSCPGPSPTSMTFAWTFPSPKAVRVLVSASLHLAQFLTASFSFSNGSCSTSLKSISPRRHPEEKQRSHGAADSSRERAASPVRGKWSRRYPLYPPP